MDEETYRELEKLIEAVNENTNVLKTINVSLLAIGNNIRNKK